MKELGWYETPGVKILEGKWQDFVESEELLSVGGFDVIYTDTFSEDYKGKNCRFRIVMIPSDCLETRPSEVLRARTRPACRTGVALQFFQWSRSNE